MKNSIKAVLFDLDGTLLDTAADLGYALNLLLKDHDREEISLSKIRTVASDGAQGLLQLGFSITDQHVDYPRMRAQFLEYYAANIANGTEFFPGMNSVLATLEKRQLSWGIVTNKNQQLTHLLLEKLNLPYRPHCVICGDTLKFMKPHPAPLIHASQLLNCSPFECVYIGDAQRDIEAGRRAGMHTLVALYGYINQNCNPQEWGADSFIKYPEEIISWIDEKVLLQKELAE